MTINFSSTKKRLKIYFDNILHVYIKNDIQNLVSYIDDERKMFVIDIETSNNKVKLEYENRNHWEEVLSILTNYLP